MRKLPPLPPLPLATGDDVAPFAVNCFGTWNGKVVEFCFPLTTTPHSAEQIVTAIYSKMTGKELSRRRSDWECYGNTRKAGTKEARACYVFNAGIGCRIEFELVRTLDAPRETWNDPAPAVEPAEPIAADSVQVTVAVRHELISNALIGAFEGGSNYWLQSARLASGTAKDSNWYADSSLFGRDYRIAFRFDDPNKDEGNGRGRKTIGPADMALGLRIMAEKQPRHFADLISENDDAATHDVLLQCVVLGSVIYG